MARFAAIGLDHRHIYDLVAGLHDAGQECAGYCPETSDERVLAGFRKHFPQIPSIPRERLLDDHSIAFVVTAARPCDRAAIAVAAMRRGKDVMVDKPAVTSFDQLDDVQRVVEETKRIWSVCFSERFLTPSTLKALELVRGGAIGRIVQTIGLGPHRLNRDLRPADGLPTWGDGRLFLLGTEGTIELRKYVDIAGRDGTDHLFLVDKKATRHIDCAALPVSYFRDFAADVAHRTETAMPQRHAFTVCRLALEAQTRATRFTPS